MDESSSGLADRREAPGCGTTMAVQGGLRNRRWTKPRSHVGASVTYAGIEESTTAARARRCVGRVGRASIDVVARCISASFATNRGCDVGSRRRPWRSRTDHGAPHSEAVHR